jgi:glycosyltransferase involved in cell wall biosynthesis
MQSGRRYVVVSPCRDEAKFIRRTLDSVAAQTILPALWVVVDDGSTDDTPRILDEYARRLPWLRVIHRDDRGRRFVGAGVTEAFYVGLDTVDLPTFDYVCKLDTDLDLPPRYFETLIRRMEAEPRLGSTSGKPWFHHPRTGVLTPERIGDEMSVGASKFYRTTCFREIGGFVRNLQWDAIDCHRARMHGWIVESVDAEDLRFLHLRPMGSSHKSIWHGRAREGRHQWVLGSWPPFVLASATWRLFTYPLVTGSTAWLWGYLSSAVKRVPRYEDPEFRRFLRRYQRASLVMGKRAAARRMTDEGAGRWTLAHGGASGPGAEPRVACAAGAGSGRS